MQEDWAAEKVPRGKTAPERGRKNENLLVKKVLCLGRTGHRLGPASLENIGLA